MMIPNKPQNQWTAEESAQVAAMQIASATPKPRARERTPESDEASDRCRECGLEFADLSVSRKLEAERDLLKERERELVEALEDLCSIVQYAVNRLDTDQAQPQVSGDLAVQLASARAALAKACP